MIHKLFFLLLLSVSGVSYAQFTTSPFSTRGIGEPGGLTDPLFGGIGNASSAIMDSTVVNIQNPSSYALLAKGQPLFSIGLSSRLSQYSENGLSKNSAYTNLNQLAMVIPAFKNFGLAFGLQPFSRRGYDITQKEGSESDTFVYNYVGSGTTQQVFGGLAWKVLNFKRSELSIGGNYSFLFGSVYSERRAYLQDESSGGVEEQSYRLHSGYYSLGANYLQKLDVDGNSQLRIGATFTPEQQLSANNDYYFFYATNVTDRQTYSVLDSVINDRGTINYPSIASVGFNYSFRPQTGEDYKRKSVYQISVYGDFVSTQWSSYAMDFYTDKMPENFRNTQRFSFGAQYTPNFNAYDKSVGKTYFNRMRYRAGAYFGTLPYVENGTQLTEYGITAGLGLPLAGQRTNSSVNFSVQYGSRNGAPDGISEKFISINAGLIIAPAFYDRWFQKTKLN